jgi:oxepin-CoA hydrolase/3-oxo-5,6-dehydrosuberyl-CoA semialdehyde dehydrogenase
MAAPGRAGGGEELGGICGVMHYMQRTAIQGSPDIISGITGTWIKGAAKPKSAVHPFTRTFEDLSIGDTIEAGPRTVTLEDIEHFAHFTGDTFYAHMDEEAAKANPFFPGRVAHGYLLLSFAAGLFVEPAPGPGARQHRSRWAQIHEACLAGRRHLGRAHRQAQRPAALMSMAKSAGM